MPRHRDPKLLRSLHLEWRWCVLCGETYPLSLHHIYDRHDVRSNLVMLCGDGVTGCHGLVTINYEPTLRALGRYLRDNRPDTIAYINSSESPETGEAWLERRLLTSAAS